jgi:hypothetical protein
MSYIPTLVASLERRLDELATEIVSLERARAALSTTTSAGPSTPTGVKHGAAKPRARRRLARTPKAPASPATPKAPANGDADPAAASAPGAREARKPRRQPATKPALRQRATTTLAVEELERMLANATAGLSASEIAQESEAGYNRVLTLLRKLEASGHVRRTGTRRSTLWRLVTDEERIAERAAELERQAAVPGRRRGRARAS